MLWLREVVGLFHFSHLFSFYASCSFMNHVNIISIKMYRYLACFEWLLRSTFPRICCDSLLVAVYLYRVIFHWRALTCHRLLCLCWFYVVPTAHQSLRSVFRFSRSTYLGTSLLKSFMDICKFLLRVSLLFGMIYDL